MALDSWCSNINDLIMVDKSFIKNGHIIEVLVAAVEPLGILKDLKP